MLNADIDVNSQHFPAGFRREFDAHVYYTEATRALAAKLRERTLAEFAKSEGAPIFVGQLIDRPVGPHPVPMFEICFPTELFGRALLWLLHERGSLTVLVHEVTGDDPRDHSVGAIWLGDKLELDVTKLDPSPRVLNPR